METYNEIKNRILYFMEQKSMSIHNLALKSGIAPSTIKNILYGKSKNPGIITIKLICEGFEISLFEFFDTEAFKSIALETLD